MHLLATVTPLNRHLLPFPFTARREQVYSRYSLFYKGEFPLRDPMYLESVLYMDDAGCAFADEYADHVEAYSVEAWLPIEEVSLGQGADGGLFAGGDGLEWMPEARSPTQLHFDEDEGIFVAQDQVQLAVTGAVVPFDEFVSLACKEAKRELFAPRAGEAFTTQETTPA